MEEGGAPVGQVGEGAHGEGAAVGELLLGVLAAPQARLGLHTTTTTCWNTITFSVRVPVLSLNRMFTCPSSSFRSEELQTAGSSVTLGSQCQNSQV